MLDAIRSFFSSSMAPESPEEEVGDQDVRLAACNKDCVCFDVDTFRQ